MERIFKSIYFDFEYNDRQVILCKALYDGNFYTFDLRDGVDTNLLGLFIQEHIMCTFVSYALGAEITSLMRLGLHHLVKDMVCVDLMAECRQLTLSSEAFKVPAGNLEAHLKRLLGKRLSYDKDKMRDLIIHQDSWTDEEWEDIGKYCEDDCNYLPALESRVNKLLKGTQGDPLIRGEYVRKMAEMDFESKGFPIFGGDLVRIYDNKAQVKTDLVESLPTEWRDTFVWGRHQIGKSKVFEHRYSHNKLKFITLLEAHPEWMRYWPSTDKGMPSTAKDNLKMLANGPVPEVEDFRQVLKSLGTLNGADLREQIVIDDSGNPWIRPQTVAFSARTGRNGLKPTRGYLLNLPKWQRGCIRPAPGQVFMGADWSQQEVLIAAHLSGDKQLLDAYKSGDVYLALAKQAGAVPTDGTKADYPLERDMFKTLQLAISYGKGLKSLQEDFWGLLKPQGWGEAEAKNKAAQIFRWHKQAFVTYWSWIHERIRLAYRTKHMQTEDGSWSTRVDRRKTRETQLLNWPMQANAAVMMRLASLNVYDEWIKGNLGPLLCSQHDAFYVNSTEEDAIAHSEILIACMDKACKDMGLPVVARVDLAIYNSEEGYLDHLSKANMRLWSLCTKNREGITS